MNHLAHCFLSFGDEDLLVGNFIGDFVKGKTWQSYPEGVQRGILLHRSIDSFTDNHAMTGRIKERIRPFARRYAGPVADVLCDHLLVLNWGLYTDEPFEDFAQKTYGSLARRAAGMPLILQERLPRMLAAGFLHGYTTQRGMRFVLERFSRRLPADLDMGGLADCFFEHLGLFSEDFRAFFPELIFEVREIQNTWQKPDL